MKSVRDMMTADPVCCLPQTLLQECAELMASSDCGQVPVIRDMESKEVIGVITDRDIVMRCVAKGFEPATCSVGECMTSPATTIKPEASLDECLELMARKQIRRLPVVDQDGLCGIIAQADIAKNAKHEDVGAFVREISRAS